MKKIKKYLPLALLLAAIVSGAGTYVAIAGAGDPLSVNQGVLFRWVLADLVILLGLGSIVSIKVAGLWLVRRKESVGSRLQIRIVKRFGLVAIVPTIIVAIFSSLYFHFGVHAWFNDRVGTALNESVRVAEGYLAEHKKVIEADALAMASDLNRQASVMVRNPKIFNKIVSTQAAIRSLTEAVVFQNNNILAQTAFSFSLSFGLDELSPDVLRRANEGEVVILTSDNDDRVRALVKLANFFDTYLLVGRLVDSNVLQHVELTKGSADEYQDLRNNISRLQVIFSILFGLVSMLILLAAIWFGIMVSGEMVKPVSVLVRATEKVKGGDLATRVYEGPENDEIGILNRAFNRMTGQLEKQRSELIEVNRQIDERRRLIEAVLAGVSAGVVSLDRDKKVRIINRSAATLLGIDQEKVVAEDFTQLYPSIGSLIEKAVESDDKFTQSNVNLHIDNRDVSFHVRIVAEEFSGEIEGYIVTFDDITELQSAQRRAAWSDVARRIAHEIKNPLTPIQLASERLKSKYLKEISTDPENFAKYIDTIGRHVGDIRKMVEEFVNFARLPAPVFNDNDICQIIRDAVFSREFASPDIKFDLQLPDGPVLVNCDRGQITQVFTNLIKNAAEALEGKVANGEKGVIKINVEEKAKSLEVAVEDNGAGFPEELMGSITEPYVTTREKGTGLGLAIVKKIIDDHGAKLLIENKKEGEKLLGARVVLAFRKST